MRPYDISHGCLERVNLTNFKYLVAKKSYLTLLLVYFNHILHVYQPTNIIFVFTQTMVRKIKKLFYEKYRIPHVIDKPLCDVIVYIEYSQRTEPRSNGLDHE